jgi:nucleotide-binding universal stress UspA family protein
MRILICTIGSKRRKSTLRYASKVAEALTADTTLLGVVDKKRRVEELEQTLQEVALSLSERELPVQVRVEVGDAEDIVIGELETTPYDLVVLGSLGRKRSHRRLFGSVAMCIVERAQTSVLVYRGDRSRLSRILICTSGTEQGHQAVWAGASLACGAGAQATVLHIVDAMPSMYVGLEKMEETLAELLQSATERSRELTWAAQVVKSECEISELKLRRGIVADEILRESQEGDHDLIVVGSSMAVGGLVRALLGDVTREIVSRAQCPVLVVRPLP